MITIDHDHSQRFGSAPCLVAPQSPHVYSVETYSLIQPWICLLGYRFTRLLPGMLAILQWLLGAIFCLWHPLLAPLVSVFVPRRPPNGLTLNRERRVSQPAANCNRRAPIVGCSVLFGGSSQ